MLHQIWTQLLLTEKKNDRLILMLTILYTATVTA